MGELDENSIENSICCEVRERSEIDLSFGRLGGRFQKDVIKFVEALALLDYKTKELKTHHLIRSNIQR